MTIAVDLGHKATKPNEPALAFFPTTIVHSVISCCRTYILSAPWICLPMFNLLRKIMVLAGVQAVMVGHKNRIQQLNS